MIIDMCLGIEKYIAGCDALACAVGSYFPISSVDILGSWQRKQHFILSNVSVWNHGLWKHCYVRKRFFLVLGSLSCSILWCNMGTVSQTIFFLPGIFMGTYLWISKILWLDCSHLFLPVIISQLFCYLKPYSLDYYRKILNIPSMFFDGKFLLSIGIEEVSHVVEKKYLKNNDTCLAFFQCSFFTNTLILPVINGPTEGLMLIYMCHFFTFLVGTYPCFKPWYLFWLSWEVSFVLFLACFFVPLLYLQAFCVSYICLGAEWWIQLFGKSFPFLGWVPYFSGKSYKLCCFYAYSLVYLLLLGIFLITCMFCCCTWLPSVLPLHSEIPTYKVVLYMMIAFGCIPTVIYK